MFLKRFLEEEKDLIMKFKLKNVSVIGMHMRYDNDKFSIT